MFMLANHHLGGSNTDRWAIVNDDCDYIPTCIIFYLAAPCIAQGVSGITNKLNEFLASRENREDRI
jgi:hypothetical protein